MKQLFTLSIVAGLISACQSQEGNTKTDTSVDTEKTTKYTDSTAKDVATEEEPTDCSSDRKVPIETAEFWKKAWILYQNTLIGEESPINEGQSFSFSKLSIEATAPANRKPEGLRVYFGLDDSTVAAGSSVVDYLLIMLVPTESCNDLYKPDSTILASGTMGEVLIPISDARKYMSYWKSYMDATAPAKRILKIYAYNFNWNTVMDMFDLDPLNKVRFTPAVRTVSFPGRSGFNVPIASSYLCQSATRGFLAFDLVIEHIDHNGDPIWGDCKGIVDFANPCPIYCGDTNLTKYHH